METAREEIVRNRASDTKLNSLLSEVGLRQKDLIGVTGLSRSRVSEIARETGSRVSRETAKKICSAINKRRMERGMPLIEPEQLFSNPSYLKRSAPTLFDYAASRAEKKIVERPSGSLLNMTKIEKTVRETTARDAARLGEKVFRLRRRKNMTQEELAKEIGVTPSAISMIEKGKVSVGVKTFMNLCEAFDVYPSVLGSAGGVTVPKAIVKRTREYLTLRQVAVNGLTAAMNGDADTARHALAKILGELS